MHLEGERNARERELQITLEQAQLRVKSYEALEVEIDEAVLRTAAQQESLAGDELLTTAQSKNHLALTDGRPAVDGLTNILPAIQRGLIPSDPQRRVRQAVYLAQRLLATEKRLSNSEKRVSELTDALTRAEGETETLKAQLGRCSQPVVYLTDKLSSEESKRVAAGLEIERLKALNNQVMEALRVSRNENKELRDRLKLLLERRGELQVVKKLLEHVSEMDDDDDESEEESESEEEREKVRVIENGVGESKVRTPPRALLPPQPMKSSSSLASSTLSSNSQPYRGGSAVGPGKGE